MKIIRLTLIYAESFIYYVYTFMSGAIFILEYVDNKKFPYRLSIKNGENDIFVARVQSKRPGQKGNVFCVREKETDEQSDIIGEVERVPIISLNRYGKKLSLVLDRPINKRCDFLFLTKKYKNKEGEYEQIFWRTQQGLRENKPKYKLSTYHKGNLTVIIDSNERYPRSFPECETKKLKLPTGDYGIEINNEIIGVVERKTFENMLGEFGKMTILHKHLDELQTYKYSALVIESNYSNFLSPKNLQYYKPVFVAKVFAEISAFHPKLQVIFAGTRKLANEWTHRFFEGISAREADNQNNVLLNFIDDVEIQNSNSSNIISIKRNIMNLENNKFTVSELKKTFANISESRLRKALQELFEENKLSKGKEKNSTIRIKN